MSTILDTDIFAIGRGGKTYKVTFADIKANRVHDTDLFIIGRGKHPYHCTFADLKKLLAKAPVIKLLTLTDSPQAERFTSATFASTVSLVEGMPVSAKGIKAWVEGQLKSAVLTSAIARLLVGPVYSDFLTVSSGSWYSSTYDNRAPFKGADAKTATASGSVMITFEPTIPISGAVIWTGFDWGTSNVGWEVNINGTGWKDVYNVIRTSPEASSTKPTGWIASGTPSIWYNISAFSPIHKIETRFVGANNGSNGPGIYPIVVDGMQLTDSLTVLELADTTDLARLAAGDALTEVTSTGTAGDATGTVGSVDVTAKTITLGTTAGTWDVGSKVKGPVKTAPSITVTPATSNVIKIDTATKTLPDFTTGMKDFSGAAVHHSDAKIFSAAQPLVGYIRPGVQRGSGISFTHLPGGGLMCYHSLRLYAGCTLVAPDDDNYIAFNVSTALDNTNKRPPGAGAIVGNYKPIVGDWNKAANYHWVDFPITGPVLLKNLVVIGYFPRDGRWGSSIDDMGLTAIEVDGIRLTNHYSLHETILTFADGKGLKYFKSYDEPVQAVSNATGKVASVDASNNQMHFNNHLGITGTFVVGQPLNGKVPVQVPADVKLYCKLNAGLTVTDLQSADPGYTTVSGTGPYTVTFPATLPSGNAPDTDLPAGTTLTTEVQASNASGTVHKTSNTITPA